MLECQDRYSASQRGTFRYTMYGVQVESDIRLPLPPVLEPQAAPPAWVFRRAGPRPSFPPADRTPSASSYCSHGTINCARYDQPDGVWIWNRSIATFHIWPDARRVDIHPEADLDEQLLGFVLVGQISVLVLERLGRPSLHGSAIIADQGAVVFLGPKGRGKSTMAASFLRHGAALLTDDVLPLRVQADGVYGEPGLSIMKVWRETAECTLALEDELPNMMATFDKKVLALEGRFPMARTAARVRGIYFLERVETPDGAPLDSRFQTLTGQEGLTTLLAHTAYGELLPPVQAARLLPLYARLASQVPVKLLRYPEGFVHQDQVHARILADLSEQ